MDSELETLTARFLTSATDFCAAVDSYASLSPEAFLSKIGNVLVELYAHALALPRVEPNSYDADKIPLHTEELGNVWIVLRDKLGPLDMYWTVFNSTQQGELIQAGLSQDISEIYSDMRDSLEIAGRSAINADVVWALRDDFRHHWGRHAVDALKAIHDLRASETID